MMYILTVTEEEKENDIPGYIGIRCSKTYRGNVATREVEGWIPSSLVTRSTKRCLERQDTYYLSPVAITTF
jgi:hypothetical protein